MVAGEERHDVSVDRRAGTAIDAEGETTVREVDSGPGLLRLEIDGAVETFHLHEAPGAAVEVIHRGELHVFRDAELLAEQRGTEVGEGSIRADMPGTVLRVEVEQGQEVSEGETLLVLEAMKMELSIAAPFDGVVETVGAAAGDRVAVGHLLAEVGEGAG